MKVQLRKIGITDAFTFWKAIRNPEVGNRLRYNSLLGFALKELKDFLIQKKSYNFKIVVDGKFAGGIGLRNPNKAGTIYGLGFFVAKEYWNKGIATQAVREMLKFGFGKLKLKKIVADNTIDNPASGRVLKKAGLKLIKIDKRNDKMFWSKTNDN